jgi:hypothetical protein
LYGIQLVHNEYWAAAMARAVNDWQIAEWLEKEPRLRASIVVPTQNPEMAAEEIERLGDQSGFVQVLLLVRTEMPLGKRHYWPIYEAAERHSLVIGIHAGGSPGNPITPVGWPSHYLEDYVSLAQAFQTQLVSLVSEGVFGLRLSRAASPGCPRSCGGSTRTGRASGEKCRGSIACRQRSSTSTCA